MERKYSDSTEYKQRQMQTAINENFPGMNGDYPYSVKATYPDDQIVVVRDWNKDEYLELSYTTDADGNISFGEPQPTTYEEVYVTKEQINNSMKQGEPFILLNSETENPVYRVLVQTPDELPAEDIGIDSVKYDEEGIKQAIGGLLGEYVYDRSQDNHSRLRNPKTPNKFAQVVNTGYCPNYGGYTDWEVFDSTYVPLIEQALNSRNKGLPVKEGPSTEVVPKSVEKYGNNSIKFKDFKYNGLIWDKNPRDKSTGVCNVVLNSIPEELKGDGNLKEEIVNIKKDEYDSLKQIKADYEELEPKYKQLDEDYKKGETLYNKGKTKYTELKEEEGKLREQLIPIWTKEGEVKEQMVNSILERVPEAEREAKRKDFEAMTPAQLEGVMVLNSMEVPTGAGGIIEGTNPPTPTMTEEEKQFQQIKENESENKSMVRR